jgi:hypothetical protein
MTTVAVLCDPPRPGVVLSQLVESGPLGETEAAELYAALLRDSVVAAQRSGGETLVNYRPRDDGDAEAAVRDVLDPVVDEETRFEVQVGETFSGRAGNTVTHLLEREGVDSVAVARPEAAFLARTDVDRAAMKLRSGAVVLGATPDGRVYFAAFSEPIDFTDAYRAPALETLTDRALDAGLDVEFIETKPVLETPADLAAAMLQIRTRRRAEGLVPRHLAEWVAASELTATVGADGLSVGR